MYHPPKTYHDWVTLIDLFKSESFDEQIVQCFENGVFEHQPDIYYKLISNIWDAITFRLKKSLDNFNSGVLASNGDENTFTQLYLSFRDECEYIKKILKISLIREKESIEMNTKFLEFLNKVQSSFEKMADTISKNGKLKTFLRNNSLNTL